MQGGKWVREGKKQILQGARWVLEDQCAMVIQHGWRQAITSTRAAYLNKVRLDLNWSDCLKTSPRPSFVPDPLIPDPSKSDLREVLVLAEGDVSGPAEHEVFWVPLDELEGLAAADDLHRDAVPPQELAANGGEIANLVLPIHAVATLTAALIG